MRAERLASDADPQSRAGAEFRGPCRRVEGLSAGTRPLSGEMWHASRFATVSAEAGNISKQTPGGQRGREGL